MLPCYLRCGLPHSTQLRGGYDLAKILGLLKSPGCFADRSCKNEKKLDAGSSAMNRISHEAESIAADEESRSLLRQRRARRAQGTIFGLLVSLTFIAVLGYKSGRSRYARSEDVSQVVALNQPPTQDGEADSNIAQDAEDDDNSNQCPTPSEVGGSSEVNHGLLGRFSSWQSPASKAKVYLQSNVKILELCPRSTTL